MNINWTWAGVLSSCAATAASIIYIVWHIAA